MLGERKKEQIRQLFEQGENISDIARAVNVDRKTVRTHIDKLQKSQNSDQPVQTETQEYVTQEPQNSQLDTQNPSELENSPDTQDMQKTVQQESIEVPKEILEKAKELFEEKKKKEIIDEFMKTGIQDQFNSGWWLTKENHEIKIKEVNKKHKSEMSQLMASHRQEKFDLEAQIRKFWNENENLKKANTDLNDYIENYLADSGKRERKKFEIERIRFDNYMSEIKTLSFDTDNRIKNVEKREKLVAEKEEKQNKREMEQDGREKQIKQILKKIEEGQQKIKGELENLRQKEQDLNMTTEELLKIRGKNIERKIQDRANELRLFK